MSRRGRDGAEVSELRFSTVALDGHTGLVGGRISSSVFVGRDTELTRLAEHATATGAGRASIVLLGGDAGIGKTRLVAEFADLTGTAVLMGGCLQLGDAAAPLAPITEILRTLAHDRDDATLAQLLSGVRAPLRALLDSSSHAVESRHDEQVGAARMHEAVLSLLETLGADDPVVIALEDLHWATESTLALTTFLAHNPPRGRVLLVMTFRADELHRRHPLRPVLADLGRLATVDRIDLPPLTEDDQRRQLAAIRGADGLPESDVAAILGRAEGNPFYAEELLAATAGGVLPTTLREILADRLATLPARAAEVVRVAAAAGRGVDHRLLESVAALDPDHLTEGLRTAVESGILLADARGYRFRHALLQEAAYDALLPGERLRLHAAIAEALTRDRSLAATGGTEAEIAHHAAEAMQFDRAYGASIAAASQSHAVFAFDASLLHLERALRLRGACSAEAVAEGPPRIELLRRAGRAADAAGDSQRSVTLLESALSAEPDNASPEDLAEVLNDLALTHMHTADLSRGIDATTRALAIAPERSTQRATALAMQALHLAIPSGRPGEALAPARAALDLARDLGAPEQEIVALFALGSAHGKLGELDTAEPLLREAIDLAGRHEMTRWATLCHINLASFLSNAGRLEDAAAIEGAWAEYCGEQGYAVAEVDFMRCNTVDGLILAGRIADATVEFARVRRHDSAFLIPHRIVTSLALHLCQARFDDAATLLAESREDLLGVFEPQYLLPLAEGRAMLALVAGRHDDAWEHLDAVRTTPPDRESPELVRPAAARVEADRVADLPVDHDDRRRALARIDDLCAELTTLADGADAGTVWSSHVAAAHAQIAAERTRAAGHPDPAAWAAAEQAVAAQRRAPQVAYLRLRRAEALVGVGDRDAATTLLGEVHADCVDRGLAWVAQQAEALAKRARIRLPGLAPPDADPFGLTARERDVLALVADGLTNPQIGARLFISEKTASVHVSHILAKLEVTNRARAGALARQHGLTGSIEGAT